jgi:hypothetical protein
MRVVFLDIDGVLNGHDFDEGAQSCRMQYRCILQLNRIIKATGCKFVLSSSWRYMLLSRGRKWKAAMTTKGFEYLMRTHGTVGFRLLGTTCSDEECGWDPASDRDVRGEQITRWLTEHGTDVECYVAIDDLDLGITEAGHPLVLTNGKWGLGRRAAGEAIKVLTAG